MAPNYNNNPYVSDPVIHEDGAVGFACSQDEGILPWLALPPHHPVVIQTQSFWTAVGASMALAGLEATQWTALTWLDWELGDGDAGHASKGIYRRKELDGKLSYEIVLSNDQGAQIVTMRGRGVVFRNRNFEKWREEAKARARKAVPNSDFNYVGADAIGMGANERALVAPFDPDSNFVEALVTPENGFAPNNPVIGGSGDHVNSTHFHEAARQALFQILGRTGIDTSGEMKLSRYVELGTPFRLNIMGRKDREIEFAIEQMGVVCAEMKLKW